MKRFFTGGGLGATTVSQAAILLAGAGSGITLARSLGPQSRGELAIVLLWPGILTLFGDLGLGFAFSYFAGKGQEIIDDLWTLAVAAGLLIGVVAALLGWQIVPHLVSIPQGPVRQSFGLGMLSVPVVLISGFQAYILLGKGLIADYNSIRLSTAVANLLLVLVVAALGLSTVHSFVVSWLASQTIGLALSTALMLKRFQPRFHANIPLVSRLLSYGMRAQAASLAAQTNLRADQTIMSIVLAPRELGLYVIAVTVSGVLSPFMNALAVVILPRTTHSSNNLLGAQLAARHVKLACLLSLPLVALSIVVMPWLLPALFGRAYSPAILSAQILVAASLFQGLNAVLGNALRGMGRPSLPAVAEGFGVLATLLLLFVLLPRIGFLGAAITSLVVYTAVSVVEFGMVAQIGEMTITHLVFSPLDEPLIARSRHLLRSFMSR